MDSQKQKDEGDESSVVNSQLSPVNSSIVLYQTEDGQTRIRCRFENETIWLTQKLIAELFQKDVRTINEHIQTIIADKELSMDSVIRKFRITAADGTSYETQHYSLEMILAVGYRVRSPRGTQFRQWATARLAEYLVKGFTMDDERQKNPPGPGVPDYFDELLNRIVVMFLDYAEDQARRRKQVFMSDWTIKLDEFLRFNDRSVLPDAGSVSREQADAKAKREYEKFSEGRRTAIEAQAEQDMIRDLENIEKKLKKTKDN